MTTTTALHARAHAFYGTACPDGCEDAAKWAARRLITPRAYLTAARAATGLDSLAGALGVTPGEVCDYIASLDPDEWLIMVRLTGTTGDCRG